MTFVSDDSSEILRPVVEEDEVEEKTRKKLFAMVEDITEVRSLLTVLIMDHRRRLSATFSIPHQCFCYHYPTLLQPGDEAFSAQSLELHALKRDPKKPSPPAKTCKRTTTSFTATAATTTTKPASGKSLKTGPLARAKLKKSGLKKSRNWTMGMSLHMEREGETDRKEEEEKEEKEATEAAAATETGLEGREEEEEEEEKSGETFFDRGEATGEADWKMEEEDDSLFDQLRDFHLESSKAEAKADKGESIAREARSKRRGRGHGVVVSLLIRITLSFVVVASFPSLLASSEPLLDSDEESRRIKSWLREDDKIEFDFNVEREKGETEKKVRPKSGRMTAADIDERRVGGSR